MRRRRVGGLKTLSKNRSRVSTQDNPSLRTKSKQEELCAMVAQLELAANAANPSPLPPPPQSSASKTTALTTSFRDGTTIVSVEDWLATITPLSPNRRSKIEKEIQILEAEEQELRDENLHESKVGLELYAQELLAAKEQAIATAKNNWDTIQNRIIVRRNESLYKLKKDEGEQKKKELHVVLIPYPILNPFTDGVPVLPIDPFGGNKPPPKAVPSPTKQHQHDQHDHQHQQHQHQQSDGAGRKKAALQRKKSSLGAGSSASATAHAAFLSQTTIPYPLQQQLQQRPRPRWPTTEPMYPEPIMVFYPLKSKSFGQKGKRPPFPSSPSFVDPLLIPYPSNTHQSTSLPGFPTDPFSKSKSTPTNSFSSPYPLESDQSAPPPPKFPMDPFSSLSASSPLSSFTNSATSTTNLIPYPMHSQTPPPQSEYELFVKEWTPKLSNLCNKYCPQSVPKIPKLLTKYNTRTMMIGMLHQKFFDKYKVAEDDQKILYFKSDESSNQLTFPASPIIWGTTTTTASAYWKQQTLVYMKISKNGTPLGQIIIHLRDDVAPLTCENFLGLVTHKKGYGYNGSEFHRVVLGFMIQGGDYELNNGRGGQSIWGGSFKDENFDLQHERGALSMANSGPNTQKSQFFICQSRSGAKHLDNKHVVFGYVVDGMDIVTTINQGPTADESRPKDRIVIDDCGVYEV